MAHKERQAERIFRLVEELSGVKVCYWPLGLPIPATPALTA